jgi:hypothetical protein
MRQTPFPDGVGFQIRIAGWHTGGKAFARKTAPRCLHGAFSPPNRQDAGYPETNRKRCQTARAWVHSFCKIPVQTAGPSTPAERTDAREGFPNP